MRGWMVLAALAVGCSGGETADPAPTVAPPEAPSTITPPTAATVAVTNALVPSPMEMDRAVQKAGLGAALAGRVPKRTFDMGAEDVHAVAVRTGVLLADTVFSGKDATKEELDAKGKGLRRGFARIGAGQGVLSVIDDVLRQVEDGDGNRDDVLRSIDDIASVMVPEDGWGPDDRTGPLVQAGVWLEGAHLVAGACVDAQNLGAANDLLRETAVVDYFLGYLKVAGSEHAPDPVVDTVVSILEEVRALVGKEALEMEDVEKIRDSTGRILSIL